MANHPVQAFNNDKDEPDCDASENYHHLDFPLPSFLAIYYNQILHFKTNWHREQEAHEEHEERLLPILRVPLAGSIRR